MPPRRRNGPGRTPDDMPWPTAAQMPPDLAAKVGKYLGLPGALDKDNAPAGFAAFWAKSKQDLWQLSQKLPASVIAEAKEALSPQNPWRSTVAKVSIVALLLRGGIEAPDAVTNRALIEATTDAGVAPRARAAAMLDALWPAVAHDEAYERAPLVVTYEDSADAATVRLGDDVLGTDRIISQIKPRYGKRKGEAKLSDEGRARCYMLAWASRGTGDAARDPFLFPAATGARASRGGGASNFGKFPAVFKEVQKVYDTEGPGGGTEAALARFSKLEMEGKIDTNREITRLQFAESEANRLSLPLRRFPAFVSNWEARSGGCIRCTRPFYEPEWLWVRDETRTRQMRLALGQVQPLDAERRKVPDLRRRVDAAMAGPRGSTGAKLKELVAATPGNRLPAGRILADPDTSLFLELPARSLEDGDEWPPDTVHLTAKNAGAEVWVKHANDYADEGERLEVRSFGTTATQQATQQKVRLRRYNDWQALSNLCSECGIQLRNARLLDDTRPMEATQLEGGARHRAAVRTHDRAAELTVEAVHQLGATQLDAAALKRLSERHRRILRGDGDDYRTGDVRLPGSYTRWAYDWRRRRDQRASRSATEEDDEEPPPLDAGALLRMGVLSPEDYAAAFRNTRGNPRKGRATVEVHIGDARSGLLERPWSAQDKRDAHDAVISEVSELLAGTLDLNRGLSHPVREALVQLGTRHYAQRDMADKDDTTYEAGRVLRHDKTKFLDLSEPVPGAQRTQRKRQARGRQQSKFMITLVMHRRATYNDEHNAHVMHKMAGAARRLLSEPAHLASIFRFGLNWQQDHWEPWHPRKEGGRTTHVGHYISWVPSVADYVRAARNAGYDGETDAEVEKQITGSFLRRGVAGGASAPHTLASVEADHPYAHTVTGGMLLPDEYQTDYYEDVVDKVDGRVGVEVGPVQRLFHFHMILDVWHRSKVAVDQRAFKEFFHACWVGLLFPGEEQEDGSFAPGEYEIHDPNGRLWIPPHERLYMDIRLMAEDAYASVVDAYVKKDQVGFSAALLQAQREKAENTARAALLGQPLATFRASGQAHPPTHAQAVAAQRNNAYEYAGAIGDGRPAPGPPLVARPATSRTHALETRRSQQGGGQDDAEDDDQGPRRLQTPYERQVRANIRANKRIQRQLGLLEYETSEDED